MYVTCCKIYPVMYVTCCNIYHVVYDSHWCPENTVPDSRSEIIVIVMLPIVIIMKVDLCSGCSQG